MVTYYTLTEEGKIKASASFRFSDEVQETDEEIVRGYGGQLVFKRETETEEYKREAAKKQKEQRLQELRGNRVKLLEAFDKWEKAVLRGRAEDDAEIMNWYRDILDLKAEAFENVPEAVRYYL